MPEPVAATVNEADWPAVTNCAEGCVVIVGPTDAAFTVNVTDVDVTELTEFVTTTAYVPAFALVVLAIV